MPSARRLGLRILTEYAGPGSAITDMHDKGLLGADNIFNHCTRLTDNEWRLLKAAGAHVTVTPGPTPSSASRLGECVFRRRSTTVSSRHCRRGHVDERRIFAEMRTAFFLQRSIAQAQRVLGKSATPAAVTVRATLEAATVNSAAGLGLAEQIGTLTPGKQADIIAIRTGGIAVFCASTPAAC